MNIKYRLLEILKNCTPFTKRLVISYNSILLVFFLLGMLLYNISITQVQKGVNHQNQLTLTSSVSLLDNSFQSITAISNQVRENPNLMGLAYHSVKGESDFYQNAYMAERELRSLLPLEQMLPISNSFIYMKNHNYIISPITFSDFDLFYKYTLNYPVASSNLFCENLLIEDNWRKLIPVQKWIPGSDKYIYIQPLNSTLSFSEEKTAAVLCYEFDSDLIATLFSDINLYDIGGIFAFNLSDESILQLSEQDSSLSPDIGILKNLSYHNNCASFYDEELGHKMLVTRATSNFNGWTYYLIQPYDQAYLSIVHYRTIFLLITCIALLFGCILIFFLSIYNSRPVSQMHKELSSEKERSYSLNTLVEKNKPVVTESYMRRIMEGSITTSEEMDYIIQQLGLNRYGIKYQVLYTEVYPSENATIHTNDMELCIQNYDILVREALKRYFPDTGYIYKPSDRVFAILIATPKNIPFDQVLKHNREIFIRMHNELLENYNIWINGGFGGRNEIVSYTWKSYQQAREAKSITTHEKYILCMEDFRHASDVYYYPESIAVQLSGFIATGNKDQVSEVFKLIQNENTVKRSLSLTQRQWLLSDVRNTVFKKRHQLKNNEIDTSQKQHVLDLIDKQFDGEISLDLLKTISLELCEVYGSASNGNDLIIKIQDYINTNYHDPNLCLKQISDQFNISENYFSFLFKKEVSENFSTYLEKLRMSKAKELVIESDSSLSTLYQYVGYNNAASFRRVFKKTFGVSPKEMRDKINAK